MFHGDVATPSAGSNKLIPRRPRNALVTQHRLRPSVMSRMSGKRSLAASLTWYSRNVSGVSP